MNLPPSSLRILLIEDSKTDAILIEKSLKAVAAGMYQMEKAETLTQAIRKLGEQEFDVVVLDLSLPDASGLNGLQGIQSAAPTLPVVLLTAHDDETLALKAVAHGAQDYLFKDKADGAAIKRSLLFAIQRKGFERVLIRQANFDTLTELANRKLFESSLDMALARSKRIGGGVGVFFLDLDRFKQVNDTLGHAAGDMLLQQVAQRLKQCIRPYDTASRIGGDEFAVLIEGIKQAGDCVKIAEKIIHLIEQPFMILNNHVSIGTSIGIATCMQDQAFDGAMLIKHADTAMYHVKLNAKGTYKFHEEAEFRESLSATARLPLQK